MTRRVFFHTVAWLGYDNQLPFFPLSTPVRGLPFLDIASHPWCQHCSLGARSYEDRTLSLKPAPLLGSREILEVRALLTIDRADLCGLSTAERTGSPVFHTLWSYVPDYCFKKTYHGQWLNCITVVKVGAHHESKELLARQFHKRIGFKLNVTNEIIL